MEALIVDEHPLYVMGLATIIQDCFSGIRIMAETNLESAFCMCDDPENQLDLVLIGIDNVDIEKYKVLNSQVVSRKQSKLIVFPSFENFLDYKNLLAIGVKGIIPKCYSMLEIMNAIQDVSNGRIHIPLSCRESLKRYLKNTEEHNKILRHLRVTKRQVEVLELMEKEMSNDQIANTLFISIATVKTHINKLFSALEVKCRTECIQRSYELGVL